MSENNKVEKQLSPYQQLDIQHKSQLKSRFSIRVAGIFSLLPGLANPTLAYINNNIRIETIAASPVTYISIASAALCSIVSWRQTRKIKRTENLMKIEAKFEGDMENYRMQ